MFIYKWFIVWVCTRTKSRSAQTDFSISSDWNFSQVSTGNKKVEHNLLAYINWTSSSQSSHKEWFQVVSSDGQVRSREVLLPYLGSAFIDEYSSCLYGYTYYLRERREHIINPTTLVRGKWES